MCSGMTMRCSTVRTVGVPSERQDRSRRVHDLSEIRGREIWQIVDVHCRNIDSPPRPLFATVAWTTLTTIGGTMTSHLVHLVTLACRDAEHASLESVYCRKI